MVHRHSIFATLAVLASAVIFLAGSTTAEISTTCFSALPSLPICAQCPGQDILLIGNCPTTDVAACVCKDADLTSQFFDLLYQGCSPPNVKSTSTYKKAAQKFIDICAKNGYTISDSKHDGSGSTPTSSSSVTPFLSPSPTMSMAREPAGSVSHGSVSTKAQPANTEPSTSITGDASPGTTATTTSSSKTSRASRMFAIGIGSPMGLVIKGMVLPVLILLL